jgi:hypothetical protein
LVLLTAENQTLRQANKVLSKYQKAKKTYLQQGGLLSQQEAQDLQDKKDIVQQVEQETKASSSRKPREETRVQYCSNCSKTGHNIYTCQIIIEISEEEDSK